MTSAVDVYNYYKNQRMGDLLASQLASGSRYNPAYDTSTQGISYATPREPVEDEPGIVSRIVDVLSRPLYGTMNLIKDTIDPNEGTQDPVESFMAGILGIDKTMGHDVLDKMDDVYFDTQDMPDWVKGVGGFALDVLGDPLSYTPLGWVAKPLKAGRRAITGEKKIEELRKAPLASTQTHGGAKADRKALKQERNILANSMLLDVVNSRTGVARPALLNDLSNAETVASISKDLAAGRALLGDEKLYQRLRKQSRINADEELARRGPVTNLENTVDARLQGRIQRMIQPVASRTIAGYTHQDLQKLFRNSSTTADRWHNAYSSSLTKIERKYESDVLADAYTALKLGRNIEKLADGPVKEAARELRPMFDNKFSLRTDNNGQLIIADTFLMKDGIPLETMNQMLDEVGIKFKFDPTKMKNPNDIVELANQWRKWDVKYRKDPKTGQLVDGPIDFLKKLDAAQSKLYARKAVMDDFVDEFGSTVPKPGWSRVGKSKDWKDSRMAQMVPHDVFFSPEAIRTLKSFDDAFMKPTSYINQRGGVAWLANNVIDPFLRIWKPAVTIARPGFHTRNAVGDFALNVMAGVFHPVHYVRAARMQKAIGRFTGDLDELKKYMFDKNMIDDLNSNKSMFSVKLKGGKSIPLSAAMAGQLAARHGLLTSYKAGGHADILANEAARDNGLSKFTEWATEGNFWMKGMSKVAEGEQHHFRLAQFSKLMSDKKFTSKYDNMEDAVNAAVTETQKFHPDVAGLNPAEAKTMRRIAPFYSWFRQSTPVIMTSMLTHPGRLTVFNKAQYEFQEAMGMEPESYTNPFPEEGRYPSFVESALAGPLSIGESQDYTYNLGTPLEGLARDFNKNVGSRSGNPMEIAGDIGSAIGGGLVGMVNPMLRAPIELSGDAKLETGQYIADKGEYIDQMLPFINQFANISGISPTGSAYNTVTGSGPVFDPQRATEKGEKDIFFNTTLLNFLTGLGIENVNRPSYQKIFHREG